METLVSWDSKTVEFLSGNNAMLLESEDQMKTFIEKMKDFGLDASVFNKIPDSDKKDGILVEYNNSKGFTYWNHNKTMREAINESVLWYGVQPLNINDLYFKENNLKEGN